MQCSINLTFGINLEYVVEDSGFLGCDTVLLQWYGTTSQET